ncbi:MAG: hypothetical protein A3A30_00030 [Candidatus Terrybacteria bacterium RIFCSPLOWO2_01_FULL_48_14]|nr:MAG: hypothetical protein A3A30_00030 [Candidatus Terrybacteria bacterium RIFCSPLOWO2_01_FULL_48_14]
MDASELRKTFLDFFGEKGHVVVSSSSLLPDDPSVLFTTAGMQQFKSYYTGELDPTTAIHSGLGRPLGSRRAASVQKCMRTSGIDDVGDETHLTFFEMLGNFSFGDYFKEEAILWGYEFLTKELKLPISYATVFGGDKDVPEDNASLKICKKIGIKDVRRAGREDNFWGPTGSEGPCGPTVEFYVGDIEVWNLVFNEYFCTKERRVANLKTPGVDTGAGLERTLVVLEKKHSVFETSVFLPLMHAITQGAENTLPRGATSFDQLWAPGMGALRNLDISKAMAERVRFFRIVADHLRAATFLIADGIVPSNLERGYIVRRLIRRAVRCARSAKLSDIWWQNGLGAIREIFKDTYPKMLDAAVEEAVGQEIEKFSKTLERGLREFNKKIAALSQDKTLRGEDAFDLYETYGFPVELTEEMAAERNIKIDRAGFAKAQESHQEVSRAGQEKKFGGHGLLLDTGELKAATSEELEKATRLHTATHLLHAALREVLGPDVRQAGSDITAERLRFDFMFSRKLTDEEKKRVEDLVNAKIQEDLPRKVLEMPYETALEQGALAFFKAKYPPVVKVFSFGDSSAGLGQVFSKEVCGGPHVERTGEVGAFKILKEEASSAGVRRIRATVE